MKNKKANRFALALKKYEKALAMDPGNIGLYDKLIEAHKNAVLDWTDEDFAKSLSWSMKKQELENPYFKRVHAKLEPGWEVVNKKIQQMMLAGDQTSETKWVEEIVAHEKSALYPLIEALLALKMLKKIVILQ